MDGLEGCWGSVGGVRGAGCDWVGGWVTGEAMSRVKEGFEGGRGEV